MKRTLSLLFALILLCLFVACHESAPPSQTAPASSEETTELAQFDGKDFRMQLSSGMVYYVFGETDTPDTFSASVIERNRSIEAQHKIRFVTCEMIDSHNVLDIKKQYHAGEAAADLIITSANMLSNFLPSDCFGDWHDLPALDLSAPHWHTEANRALEIGGHAYAVSGSASLLYNFEVYTMVFHKDLVAESNVGDLYQTVREGDWTIDTLLQTVRQTARIDKSDRRNSRFGLMLDDNEPVGGQDIDSFIYAGGFSCLTNDPDEANVLQYAPDLTLLADITEPLLDLIEKFESEGTRYSSFDYSRHWDLQTALSEERTVMGGAAIKRIPSLRQAVTDSAIGLLPYPKASEEQETYLSSVRPYQYDVMAYPANVSDPLMVAVISDRLCRDSHEVCLPLLIALASGDSQEDADMVRLIFEGRMAAPEHLSCGLLQSLHLHMRFSSFFHRLANNRNGVTLEVSSHTFYDKSQIEQLNGLWADIFSARSDQTTS